MVTEAPVVTTSAPVVTEAPVVTTSAPVVTEAPTTTTTTTEAPTTTTATTVTEAPTTSTEAPRSRVRRRRALLDTTEQPTPTPEAEVRTTVADVVATSEVPAPVADLTNAVEDKVATAESNVVEDKVVTPETNAEATESRVLATPLAAKAEQEPAKEAKDPSPAPVAQAAPAKAGEDELPNTGTSMGTLYLILSAVFLTGGAFVFAKSKK